MPWVASHERFARFVQCLCDSNGHGWVRDAIRTCVQVICGLLGCSTIADAAFRKECVRVRNVFQLTSRHPVKARARPHSRDECASFATAMSLSLDSCGMGAVERVLSISVCVDHPFPRQSDNKSSTTAFFFGHEK